MFAGLLANWWYGRQTAEVARAVVEEEREKVTDDDGIFESEDEEDTDEEMFEIRRRFRAAAAYLPRATDKLGKDALLRMYGLYKVATGAGKPDPADRPPFYDQKGRAKFDAWAVAGDRTKKEAMRDYADELEDAQVGFDPTATASTSSGGGGGGFGMRMSRPVQAEGSAGDMQQPAAASSPDTEEWDLWVAAAKSDDVDAIKRLLASNPDILLKREQSDGLTGMHWAADSGSLAVCRHLVSVRPSLVSELDIEGNHPLHLAALCGYDDVCEFLLEAGASPTIENYEKESAIDIAATPALKSILIKKADEREAAGVTDEPVETKKEEEK